ncbi:MAG: glycoside hydrolase family 127 protein, partial [Bacteroidaceae bacterium]|nr:glycoside hydrolase family 127 protein [Bacteroidaceae bacterium]
MKIKSSILLAGVLLAFSQNLRAQSDIYPEHFDLDEVTLLDGPLKTAMDINNKLLLEYDADRLLTPFIRQAGLSKKSGSKYNGWETKHPSFSNWGQSSWSLEGHVGGHYLTALA